jgi:hypothetical protein
MVSCAREAVTHPKSAAASHTRSLELSDDVEERREPQLFVRLVGWCFGIATSAPGVGLSIQVPRMVDFGILLTVVLIGRLSSWYIAIRKRMKKTTANTIKLAKANVVATLSSRERSDTASNWITVGLKAE